MFYLQLYQFKISKIIAKSKTDFKTTINWKKFQSKPTL